MDEKSRTSIESESLQLRVELKKWEADWAAAHGGKKPDRSDIKQNPEIGQCLLPFTIAARCVFPSFVKLYLPSSFVMQLKSINATTSFATCSQGRASQHPRPKPHTVTTTNRVTASSASAGRPTQPCPLLRLRRSVLSSFRRRARYSNTRHQPRTSLPDPRLPLLPQ